MSALVCVSVLCVTRAFSDVEVLDVEMVGCGSRRTQPVQVVSW